MLRKQKSPFRATFLEDMKNKKQNIYINNNNNNNSNNLDNNGDNDSYDGDNDNYYNNSNKSRFLAQDEITCFRISETWRKHATPCFRYV